MTPRPMYYLDYAATAPIDREVLAAMWPYLTAQFGNPSSVHGLGHAAEQGLEAARAAVAGVLGARPGEVVFTSGGTESDNTAIKGIALARRESVGATRVVISAVEHSAVRESARWLGRFGFEVVELGVDRFGRVDVAALAAELARPEPVAVVSVQFANNEVGTIQPIAGEGGIAARCRAVGVPVHTDAVQAAGWLDLDVTRLGVDALSLAGHKVGAPKGTGVLWLRRGVRCEPLLHGGGQERGMRSGTQDVAGAVAFATALTRAERVRADAERVGAGAERVGADAERVGAGAAADPMAAVRDVFIARVLESLAPLLPAVRLTGHPVERLPAHASFVLGGISGEAALLGLEERGVLSSSGSACRAGSTEPSPVLTAMGVDEATAQTALRFTWGRETTAADLAAVAAALQETVKSLVN